MGAHDGPARLGRSRAPVYPLADPSPGQARSPTRAAPRLPPVAPSPFLSPPAFRDSAGKSPPVRLLAHAPARPPAQAARGRRPCPRSSASALRPDGSTAALGDSRASGRAGELGRQAGWARGPAVGARGGGGGGREQGEGHGTARSSRHDVVRPQAHRRVWHAPFLSLARSLFAAGGFGARARGWVCRVGERACTSRALSATGASERVGEGEQGEGREAARKKERSTEVGGEGLSRAEGTGIRRRRRGRRRGPP